MDNFLITNVRNQLLKEVKQLPSSPGVYYFFDLNDLILYVGKATSLRSRVSSYFSRPLDNRLGLMIQKAHGIKVKKTDTVLEALILEANEINRLQPPFNILSKDDKTFVNIVVTNEILPRVVLARPTSNLKVDIKASFGPYPSTMQARKALRFLQRTFKFNCKGQPFSGQPCFYWQIGQCLGICLGKSSAAQYRRTINKAIEFLKGGKHNLIRKLKKQMLIAAQKQGFERAAILRDEIFTLEHIQDIAFSTNDSTEFLRNNLPKRLEAYDISNLGENFVVGSMIVLEYGRPNVSQYRRFKIKTVAGQNDLAAITETLTRRFIHAEWPLPEFIIIDGGKAQLQVVRAILKGAEYNIAAAGIIKGPSRKEARLILSDSAKAWLREHRLTTQSFEPIARFARSEAHRFAVNYHRLIRDRVI